MKNWSDCTKEQKVERWENALRVLRALTPHERRKHWNMGWWGERTACGTTACVAGHCGIDPWFRRRGLALVIPKGHVRAPSTFECDAHDFFGKEGAYSIFYGSGSVNDKIREVRAYIKQLKAVAP